MFYSLSASRMRIVALLIVAALSFAAVTTVAVHFAAPADAAKKKKGKKCKKGYKKNKNGKCKKKKASKTSAIVSSVSVEVTGQSFYKLEFKGTVTTRTPQASLPVKVKVTYGRTIEETVTATGDGVSNTLNFVGSTRNPRTAPGAPRRGTLTIEAIADGVSSGVK